MKTPINVLRIEAARNTGIAVEFRRRYGREFIGTVDDYRALDQAQQFALTDEMFSIIRANPDEFTEAQVTLAGQRTKPITSPLPFEQKSTLENVIEGAAQGAVTFGVAARTILVETAKVPGQIVGGVYTGVAGEPLGKTLTKVAIVAGVGLLLYGMWATKPFRDTAAATYRARPMKRVN